VFILANPLICAFLYVEELKKCEKAHQSEEQGIQAGK
jgi:hypothetical protein